MNIKHLYTVSAFFLVFVLPACSVPQSPGADRGFVNGAIYTVDEHRSWAEAVAITGGEIVFVGSDKDAQRCIRMKKHNER